MNPAEPNAILKIDVRNPSTDGVQALEVPIARSLSPAVLGPLAKDLMALGAKLTSPYELMMAQLDRIADVAESETDPKRKAQRWADRRDMLADLSRMTVSKEAGEAARSELIEAGRGTPEGLKREIIARAKAAGADLVPAEVLSVLVPGNCAKVLADLNAVLAEHPTAAT